MNFAWFGFLGTAFVGMTMVNNVLGGGFLTGADVDILNQTGLTQQVQFFLWSISIPNLSFLSGVERMIMFDYSFFGGMGQMILFFLYSVSFMVMLFLFTLLLGLGINAIRGR
jgi:hypothetical protein